MWLQVLILWLSSFLVLTLALELRDWGHARAARRPGRRDGGEPGDQSVD